MQIKLENQQVEVLSSNLLLDGYICNSIYNSATNISNRVSELSMPSVYYSKILTSGSSGSSSGGSSYSSGSGGGGGFSGGSSGGGSFGGGGGGGRF